MQYLLKAIQTHGSTFSSDEDRERERASILSLLTSLSLACLAIPSSLTLKPPVGDKSSKPLAKGRHFEIWGASDESGHALAVKVLRPLPALGGEEGGDAFRVSNVST